MTTRTDNSKDRSSRRALFWLLVTAQFVIAGSIVILLEPPRSPAMATMAILGAGFGVWAILAMGRKTLNISPAVRPQAQLIISGPYRFVRHPMYSALLVVCGAFAIGDWSLAGLLLWCGLVIVLAAKIAYEEPMLRQRFPEYSEYALRVKRIVPYVL